MSNISNLNQETIEDRPYNSRLERSEEGVVGGSGTLDSVVQSGDETTGEGNGDGGEDGTPATTTEPVITSGSSLTDVWLETWIKSRSYKPKSQGFMINGKNGDAEFNNGLFRGALSAATIDIGGADTTSFHVDIDGNVWSGAAAFADGTFKVTNAGVVTALDITATGTINAIGGYLGAPDTVINISTSGLNVGTTGHIRGGQTDYNTGTGWFLGYSTDAYKLSIGDSTKKMLWTGSTLRSTGLELTQYFTAGENLTANKFVGFKLGTKTSVKSVNGDTWANEERPDTNYGSTNTLYVGKVGALGENGWAYLKFQSLPSNIQSATFHYYVGHLPAGACPIKFATLDADFTEGTMNWTNKPASSDISGATATISSTSWKTQDISQALIAIQRAGGTFYGLAIISTGGAQGDFFYIDSNDAGANEPYISLVLEGTDGKAYLADYSAYSTSRFVIGKTLEAKSADESVLVQVVGIMDTISVVTGGVGYPVMLGIAGAISDASLSNLIDKDTRNVELGIALTTTTILFNLNRGSDFYISSEAITATGSGTSYTYTVYPSLLARKCIVEWVGTNAAGTSRDLLTVYKDSNQIVVQGFDETLKCQADWSSIINKIDLTFTSVGNFSFAPTATLWFYE